MLTEKEVTVFRNLLTQILETSAEDWEGVAPTIEVLFPLEDQPSKIRVKVYGLPEGHPLKGRSINLSFEEA